MVKLEILSFFASNNINIMAQNDNRVYKSFYKHMSKHNYYIYILTNKNNTVLYTGVSSNIEQRIYQHKTKKDPACFTSKYNVNKLIYFERFDYINAAIKREKQIKGLLRKRKIELINSFNPDWEDLYETICK